MDYKLVEATFIEKPFDKHCDDPVVGVDIDYEVLGQGNNMLMVTASGTAVIINEI